MRPVFQRRRSAVQQCVEGEREARLGFADTRGGRSPGAFDMGQMSDQPLRRCGDELVGFCEVDERPYGDGCDTAPLAWLEGIYVIPNQRRQQVARRYDEALGNRVETPRVPEGFARVPSSRLSPAAM